MKRSLWPFFSGLAALFGFVLLLPPCALLALGVYWQSEPPKVLAAGVVVDPGVEVEGLGPVVMGARYREERHCSRSGKGRKSCHTEYEQLAVYGQSNVSIRQDDGQIVTVTPHVPAGGVASILSLGLAATGLVGVALAVLSGRRARNARGGSRASLVDTPDPLLRLEAATRA